MAGIPGLAGTEHIGLTVPDLEAATRFFVDVIGGRVLFDAGPFMATDDWMARHLGVHSRAVIRKLRMIKIECGPSLELFQYEAPDQQHDRPRNSDWAGHHVAFYVEDMAAAVAHLRLHDVEVLGEPTTLTEGPSAGLTWVYFRAPWGLQLELVCAPQRLAYERAGGEWMWRPSKNGEGEHTT
jgi:catechol 2,3-dioxygenase-like lactoylglutathione lyase family enzyme